jgi:hypothetical protein
MLVVCSDVVGDVVGTAVLETVAEADGSGISLDSFSEVTPGEISEVTITDGIARTTGTDIHQKFEEISKARFPDRWFLWFKITFLRTLNTEKTIDIAQMPMTIFDIVCKLDAIPGGG